MPIVPKVYFYRLKATLMIFIIRTPCKYNYDLIAGKEKID